MLCVSYQRPNLAREGPTIAVIVRPSTAFQSARKGGGDTEEVPSVRSLMLVDTGASGSAVDHLGGTGDFREARGEAILVVITPELQDGMFVLE
jgi:hypothetical protein